MKIYEKDNDGNVLFHSDVYLGKDYISDSLKHWKYVKKEKHGDRWVYYYNDPTKNFSKDLDNSTNKLIRIMNEEEKSGKKIGSSDKYKIEAKRYEKIRSDLKKRESFRENLKRNVSYDFVKIANSFNKSISNGKKWFKSLFK